MNKKLHFKSLLLLAAMLLGASSAWAENELFYTLVPQATGGNSQPHNSYADEATTTISGIEWSVTGNSSYDNWRIGGKNLTDVNREIFSKTAMSSAITEVKLTVGAASSIKVNSLKLIVASDADFSNITNEVSATFAANSTISFTPTTTTPWATGAFYKFVFNVSVSGNSNKFVEFVKAEFYKEKGAATSVMAPTISGTESFLTSTEVTISCSTDGATIQYSTDGTTWKDYKAPFTLTETTTVKAKATKTGMTESNETSKTFTKVTPLTVGQALTAIDALADNGTIENQFVYGKISQIDKFSSNVITYWISDDGTTTSQLEVFKGKGLNGADFSAITDLTVGDEVVVNGTLQKYVSGTTITPEFAGGSQLVSRKAHVPAVATPTFSPEGGAFTTAQSVTISCTTEGADIYYTTNGEDPTSSSTKYTGAISVSESKTIKAIAIKGDDKSSVATATYTISTPKTISEVRNQGTGDVFTQGIVTSCVGTTGYIQDENAAICVYGTTLTVGDKVLVQGTLATSNGLLEIKSPIVTVVSNGNTVTPEVMTIENINKNTKPGWYVKIENATVTKKDGQNTTISQGDNTIIVRSITGVDYAVNDKLSLIGNIGYYNAVQIANPTNVEVTKIPVISAKNVTIECNATSGEIDYEISNPTTGTTLNADITEGDWISNLNVTANKVTFTATANTGGQRTAKITLSYTGADNKVVTITQKKLDSASIPFAFNDDTDNVANTFGLTGIGLGTYSTSPKLKFDSANDTLILKINEAASVLTFDVKGNPSSGSWEGTFEVKTSSDGNNYTTLASYTELASTVQHESLILGSDVRYILWVYSTKTAGNVALGNIKVFNGKIVTIPDTKYTTFASSEAVDFADTGVTICIVNVDGNVAKLTPIRGTIVPANTGVILTAENAGSYAGVITTGEGSLDGNEMVGVTTDTEVVYNVGDKYNYILQGGVFKKATGATLKAGKAYLSTKFNVEDPAAAARELKIVFDGEATAIKAVETVADKNVYDLQGRKVAAPTKGLYIINGKKMIVK